MTKEILLKADNFDDIGVLFPPNADSSCLLIGCTPDNFVASRIAMAVEDVNAHLLNLNATSLRTDDHTLVVALRIDHRNPESAARSLSRYGYEVIDMTGVPSVDDDKIRDRYNELMNYLSL
ncbi:MAG: hypothetical protein NC405_05620 [Odoribacter sp.]|nr:hypothetical protein [Odoribacter sp.]